MAESEATLPVALVLMTLLWVVPQRSFSVSYLLGWLSTLLTTYFFMETNARNALLRVRSRMISALFVVIIGACIFLHPLSSGSVLLLSMAVSFYHLFPTYHHTAPEAHTFHSYLFLSLGSLVWPPLLLLLPLFLWCQGVYFRSLRPSGFSAALFGLSVPYLLWFTYLLFGYIAAQFSIPVTHEFPSLLEHLQPMLQHLAATVGPLREPFGWQWAVDITRESGWSACCDAFAERLQRHPAESSAMVFMGLMVATGFTHYLRSSYDDKIHVRMCYYSYLLIGTATALWLLLQPHYFQNLFPLILLTSVAPMAHFIALTHTRFSNAWVKILIVLLLAVALTNIIYYVRTS